MRRTDLYRLVYKSVLAGVLIALAGILYLRNENMIVGALLFSIGLISVVVLDAKLYTGVIGYCKSLRSFADAALILILNIFSAFLVGACYRISHGSSEIMDTIMMKSPLTLFLDSMGCGCCIYLSVEAYKRTTSMFPLVLGVMAFILTGFTHCIALSFYIGASEPKLIYFSYLVICILGNSLGSLLIRFLQSGGKNELY